MFYLIQSESQHCYFNLDHLAIAELEGGQPTSTGDTVHRIKLVFVGGASTSLILLTAEAEALQKAIEEHRSTTR